MAEVLELVKELHDRRRGLIEQNRDRLHTLEAGEGDAELQKQYDDTDAQISDMGQRIQNIMASVEQEKNAAADREKFEKMLATDTTFRMEAEGVVERIRTFMRAAAGEAVLAPKRMDIDFGGVHVEHQRDGRYEVVERHDLTKGTATDGAELIPTGFFRRLFEQLVEFASIRQTNATILQTSSGENILVPKTTTDGTATLVAEAGPFLENDPQFGQITLNAYKYGQLVQVSYELLQDSAINLLDFLARNCGRAIGQATGTAYVTGTGSSQPQGIANSPTAGVTGGAGTGLTVTANDLISLYHSVVSGYRRQGYWVMNDLTAAFVRKIRDDTGGAGLGNFIWQPGLVAGAPDVIFNRPVVTDPNMAVMAINAYSIAFGDFSEYFVIRDVNGIRFERSDDFAFANDLVTFRCALRTDSKQVVNGSSGAVKFYRNGAS